MVSPLSGIFSLAFYAGGIQSRLYYHFPTKIIFIQITFY